MKGKLGFTHIERKKTYKYMKIKTLRLEEQTTTTTKVNGMKRDVEQCEHGLI